MEGRGGAGPEGRWGWWLLALAGPLVVGVASVVDGQSGNWDLLNYPLYDAHAWITGRWRIDVAPAQLQSFFNPLLYVPYYVAVRGLPPVLVAFLLGAVQGAHLPVLYGLARRLLPSTAAQPGPALAVASLGLLGPIFRSEVGTVFGDTLVSLAILAALLLVVDASASGTVAARAPATRRRLLVGGLLAGAATALKLTCVIYAPALLLVHLILATDRRAAARGMVPLALGAVLGILAFGGFWYLHLWRAYRNPLFPALNNWFRSPWARPEAFLDRRFLPRGVAEALVYPLIATWQPLRVMEMPFRDLRPAALYVGILAAPLLAAIAPERWRVPRRLAALLLFVAATWVGWVVEFGIYRYLAVVEMLAPLGLAGLLAIWLPGRSRPAAAPLALLAATQLAVVVPDWGRVGFGQLLPRTADMRLEPASMVLTGGALPTAFAALALPEDVPLLRLTSNFHRLDDPTRLAADIRARIAAHPGPFHVLVAEAERDAVAAELATVALTLVAATCRAAPPTVIPSLQGHLLVCDAVRHE